MASNELTVTTVDSEPRVRDTDLAKRLGMARPTNIRSLITANADELAGFGMLHSVRATSPMPNGGMKDVTGYYLNEEQAVLICMLSRTETAKAVRAEVIRVFTAYRRGELTPSLPDFSNPAVAARAWADEVEAKMIAQEKAKALEGPARGWLGYRPI